MRLSEEWRTTPTYQCREYAKEESVKRSMMSAYSFLHDKCGVCHHCISFMITDGNLNDEKSHLCGYSCTVCFGISSPSYHTKCILPAIAKSLRPYCESIRNADDNRVDKDTTLSNNQVSNYPTRESPTVNLPWLIAVRAHCAIVSAKLYIQNNNTASNHGIRLHTAEEVYLRIKEHVRSSLRNSILEMLDSTDNNNDEDSKMSDLDRVDITEQMHKEESGYLGVHIICLPPTTSTTNQLPQSLTHHIQQNIKQLQSNQYRILNPRKRFRGNDPTLKQGGDPKNNLELRVRRCWIRQYGLDDDEKERDHKRQRLDNGGSSSGEVINMYSKKEHDELSMIIPWLEKSTVLQWIENEISSEAELSTYLHQLHNQKSEQNCQSEQCSIYATTFRRPFYVQGTYTKCRRDVSQTPFYVAAPTSSTAEAATDEKDKKDSSNKQHNAMVRKGISSVEEEICPMLAIGCGGISQLNNEHLPNSNTEGHINNGSNSSNEKGTVVYGMCKFHASGREDMDVRMLLPPSSVVAVNAKAGISITGRPFVCEIFDALRIPSRRELELAVKSINCIEQTEGENEESNCTDKQNDIELDEKGWPQTKVQPDRYHGNNPNGVGVSSPLSLVPSKAFSSLQSQTESKVKFYRCVCWSSVPISSDEELLQKLGCSAWEEEEGGDDDIGSDQVIIRYPMKIHQSTPLRVLHRRSSDIRIRHVLSLSACRINDHWFRLRLSTEAGTYIKEFVHGDMGRTYPSIGSLIGGRVDITELDCEGIAI